jgi:Ankyrin repeats (3 copies)
MGVDKILFDMEKRALKKEEEAKKKALSEKYSSDSTGSSSSDFNTSNYSSLNHNSAYIPNHGFDGCVILFSVVFIAGVICLNLWAFGYPITHYISNFYNYLISTFGVINVAIAFGTIALPVGYIFFKIRENKRILYGYLEIGFGVFSTIITVGEKNGDAPLRDIGNANLATYIALFASIYIIVRGFDNLQQGKKQIKEYNRLLESSEKNELDTVKYLLESGVDVNCKTREGFTPLILAVQKGNLEIAKILIIKGANVDAKAKDGLTALDLAKKNNHTELINLLASAKVAS